MIDVRLTDDKLNLEEISKLIHSEDSGGIVIFDGTVRNQTKTRSVVYLDFEAYTPMAIREMEKIAQKVKEKFDAHAVVIFHRTGRLFPGETAVLIGVATAHREAAFAGCKWAIDELKKTVPIWKKEYFTDGEVWVAAHP
ncbi:MAG: hypothetical protein RJA52_927 [Bacteroidota bacterium]|jgi:molybdopterin synthase catalytic subunit